MPTDIKLTARVFIGFDVLATTGLAIGGSDVGVEIGGVDRTVIRSQLNKRPYIPGSSLRGKMRSLLEKQLGLPQNHPIARVRIHSCEDADSYQVCPVCRLFGVTGDAGVRQRNPFATPARVVVHDIALNDSSAKALEAASTDLPYTELKTEVSIDRVTSQASPRTLERVPAGAVFGPAEIVYGIYNTPGSHRCTPKQDLDMLATLFTGMQLLEDDYLGGLGSRGSGKIRFENLSISVRNAEDYGTLQKWPIEGDKDQGLTVQNVLDKLGSVPGPGVAPDEDTLLGWLSAQVPIAEDATAS